MAGTLVDLAPCLGCGELVTSDCICGVCAGNLHCWCSVLEGEGHGSHYLCATCAEPPDISASPSTEQNGQPEVATVNRSTAFASTSRAITLTQDFTSPHSLKAPDKRKPVGAANPPQSTSRRAKTSAASSRLCKGRRVYTKRSKLYHILEEVEQRACLNNNAPNNTLYYGTVVGGSSQKGWEVKYDILPIGRQIVSKVKKDKLVIVNPGDEEPEIDAIETLLDEELEEEDKNDISGVSDDEVDITLTGSKPKAKKETPLAKCTREFCDQSKQSLIESRSFSMQWGKHETDTIEWRILSDDEHADIGDLDVPSSPGIKGLDTLYNCSMADNFFRLLFPSVIGHAKLIDKYHSNPKSSMYVTVERDKIVFFDEASSDPDEIVKRCYLLLICGATEYGSGVDELWKSGPTEGRKKYADLGAYGISSNQFKAFKCAASWCFISEDLWYTEKRDTTWDAFLPILTSMNEKRRALFEHVQLLMLDESMIGWRPKTTKTGGLPNISFEPRKPVDLGSMLKNSAEAISGIMVVNDMVQVAEQQRRKKFVGEISSLPDLSEINQSTAETLRQVETSGMSRGGWVGGDAWFGSIATSVELMTKFGVYSTFIVKNNTNLYPKRALLSVLLARFDKRPGGHWVVFTATISDVDVLVMVYAWSQKGFSYFVSTCGKTCLAAKQYVSCYEDTNTGGSTFKVYNRPHIADFLYEYLPLLDEHNKQRQAILALEKKWPTRDCWFRLLSSVVGISLVDLFYLYRAKDTQKYHDMSILDFADVLCAALEVHKRASVRPRTALFDIIATHELVNFVAPGSGNDKKPLAEGQREKGHTVGPSTQGACFICRKYRREYFFSSYMCKYCNTPICMKDRRVVNGDAARVMTCLEEHLRGNDAMLRCNGHRKTKMHETQRLW